MRDYLVDAGVSINNVVERGFGKTRPIADNSSPAGRKLNRRVEMIVSGDVIGTKIGSDAEADGTKVIPPQPTPASVPLPRY